jgi:hypothetical protein
MHTSRVIKPRGVKAYSRISRIELTYYIAENNFRVGPINLIISSFFSLAALGDMHMTSISHI